jgi:hypothetical protein
LETTLHRYVWLYNQQLPQSALGSKTPLRAMKDWHKLNPELFKKHPYYLPGCDTLAEEIAMNMCLGKDALQRQLRIRPDRSVDIVVIPPARPFFQSCGAR